jgi:hypothetical protein
MDVDNLNTVPLDQSHQRIESNREPTEACRRAEHGMLMSKWQSQSKCEIPKSPLRFALRKEECTAMRVEKKHFMALPLEVFAEVANN